MVLAARRLMGFLANNVCYSVATDAADAFFSVLPPVLVKGGGASDFYHFYSKVAGTWYLDEYTITSGGVFTLQHHGVLPVPEFSVCDYATHFSVFPVPTPGEILAVFSWGFGVVVFFFFMGFIIGMVSKVISKI